jgi:hypothetical protein
MIYGHGPAAVNALRGVLRRPWARSAMGPIRITGAAVAGAVLIAAGLAVFRRQGRRRSSRRPS